MTEPIQNAKSKNGFLFWLTGVSLAMVLLLACALLALPSGIGYGISKVLVAKGAQTAAVEDVDFNPFAGQLVLRGVSVTAKGKRTLYISEVEAQWGWAPVFDKRIIFEKIIVEDFNTSVFLDDTGVVKAAGISIKPGVAKEGSQIQHSWGFGAKEIIARKGKISINSPQYDGVINIGEASVAGANSWGPSWEARFVFEGILDGAAININSRGIISGEKKILNANINIEKLPLKQFEKIVAPHLDFLDGTLSVQSTFEVTQSDKKDIFAKGNANIAVLSPEARTGDKTFAGDSLKWEGTLEGGIKDFNVQGALEANGLQAQIGNQGLSFVANELKLKGAKAGPDKQFSVDEIEIVNTRLDKSGDEVLKISAGSVSVSGATGSVLGDLKLANAKVQDVSILRSGGEGGAQAGLETLMVNAGEVMVKEVEAAQGGMYKLAKAELHKLEIKGPGEKPEAAVTVNSADASEVRYGPEGAADIGSIGIDGLKTGIRRDKNGNIHLSGAAPAGIEGKPDGDENQKAKTRIRVGSVTITGESEVAVDDEKADPPYRAAYRNINASMENIDSAAIDKPSRFTFQADINEYAGIEMEGEAYLFAERPAVELKGKVTSVELPRLSSYAASATGYDLASGQMDADFKMKTEKGVIQSEIEMVLRKMTVRPKDKKLMARLGKQLSMPLDTALELLRDGNGDIKLNFGVNGDINAPEFDIGKVINKALGGAMKSSAMTYIKLFMQPYGGMIALAELAGEHVMHVRLEPVSFKPGAAELDDKARTYLEKVATLLEKRSGLRVRVAGVWISSDREVLKEARIQAQAQSKKKQAGDGSIEVTDDDVTELARRRAVVIKDHLVKNHGVDPARIFIGLPKHDARAEAIPRADLMI